MYKHPDIYYEPQHPMLVQIREEKELYNSLSDDEVDSLFFEPSGASACGNTCKGKGPMATRQCEKSIKTKKARVAKAGKLANSCMYTKYIFFKAYYPDKIKKIKVGFLGKKPAKCLLPSNSDEYDEFVKKYPLWQALDRIYKYMANNKKPVTCDFDRYDRFDTGITTELGKDNSPLHDLPTKKDKKPKKGDCEPDMFAQKLALAKAINSWGVFKQKNKGSKPSKFERNWKK